MYSTKRFAGFRSLHILVTESAVFAEEDHSLFMKESSNHILTLMLLQAERVGR